MIHYEVRGRYIVVFVEIVFLIFITSKNGQFKTVDIVTKAKQASFLIQLGWDY